MLRALLFGVLTLGAARLAWTLTREVAVLDALGGESPGLFDYESFEPLVTALDAQVAPDEPVFVVDADGGAFAWIRYLAYPRRIDYLPSMVPDSLQSLPSGTSYVVLPMLRAADDASGTLAARASASSVERLLARDGAFALYRVRR